MTLTTDVRINWPVPAEALLDHLTVIVKGDPKTVKRFSYAPGDQPYLPGTYTYTHHIIGNTAGQGLDSLISVQWQEKPDVGEIEYTDSGEVSYDGRCPPALVIVSMDNPYGSFGNAHVYHATVLLPAVAAWLDDQGVPHTSWWWEDESWGTWHPGTVPVSELIATERGTYEERCAAAEARPAWSPDDSEVDA